MKLDGLHILDKNNNMELAERNLIELSKAYIHVPTTNKTCYLFKPFKFLLTKEHNPHHASYPSLQKFNIYSWLIS